MKLKLATSVPDQDALALALEARRSTTETIKVPRAALAHILADHGKLVDRVGLSNVEFPNA